MNNTLVSKTIDAVEIFSNSNLIIETNTQIKFNTPKLLINFIPFDQFIRNIVYNIAFTTMLNRDSANEISNDNSSPIDLTDAYNNDATFTLDTVRCSSISANDSKVDISDESKYHCITLSTSNNLILNNKSDHNNIEYNRTSVQSSLSNYIYHILNNTTFTENDLNPNVFNTTGAIDNFGTYFTNKIITSNVTTSNVCDGSGTIEPILDISSYSAVNLHIYQDGGATDTEALRSIASNIILGDNETNLKDYIYLFLDEAVIYTLTMSGTGYPGVNITLNNIVFQRNGTVPFTLEPFTYDIVFKIYEYDSGETATNPVGVGPVHPGVGEDFPYLNNVVPSSSPINLVTPLTFTNLTAGTFYSIYADITNNVTNTAVNDIRVASNIPTITPQTIESIILTQENQITIVFLPHDIGQSITLTTNFSIIESGTSSHAGTQNFSSYPPNPDRYTYNFDTGNSVSFPSIYEITLKNDLDMQKIGKIHINGFTDIRSEIDGIITPQTNNIAAPTQPGTPTVQISGTTFTLNWPASSTQTNSVTLSYIVYNIYYNSTLYVSSTSNTIVIPVGNLAPYHVVAINSYGQMSIQSSSVSIIHPTPGSISEDSVSATTCSVTFNVGSNGTPQETPLVRIYYANASFDQSNLPTTSELITDTTVSPITISTLTPEQTYYMRMIKSYTGYGTFESSEITVTTLSAITVTIDRVTKHANRTVIVHIIVSNSTGYTITNSSIVDGTIKSTNPLEFQFPADVSPGDKVVYVEVTDNSNSITAETTSVYDLSIGSFYLSYSTMLDCIFIDINNGTIGFQSPWSSSSFSNYVWSARYGSYLVQYAGFEVGGTCTINANTQTATLCQLVDPRLDRRIWIGFDVTETNVDGFTQNFTSDSIPNIFILQPGLSTVISSSTSDSFTIDLTLEQGEVWVDNEYYLVPTSELVVILYYQDTIPTDANDPTKYLYFITLSSNSVTINELNEDTDYYYLIEVTNPYYVLPSFLRSSSIRTLKEATAPLVHSTTSPSPFTIVNYDSIELHWTPNLNGDATSFTYSISIDNGATYIINNLISSTTSYTLSNSHGITPFSTYDIIVKKVIISPSGLNDQLSLAVQFIII
tara:strand:- start:1900 stop:5196 length:3297 start_codon:yes stop_codon:yes gene_type:complete